MNEQAGRHDDPDRIPLPQRIAALGRMTATELRREYAAVFGEESRSSNRQWLFRRIAWQLQLVAEGGFARQAVERSRALARELARESDLRTRPPRAPRPMEADEPATSVPAPVRRDGRLPPPGTVLVRRC